MGIVQYVKCDECNKEVDSLDDLHRVTFKDSEENDLISDLEMCDRCIESNQRSYIDVNGIRVSYLEVDYGKYIDLIEVI